MREPPNRNEVDVVKNVQYSIEKKERERLEASQISQVQQVSQVQQGLQSILFPQPLQVSQVAQELQSIQVESFKISSQVLQVLPSIQVLQSSQLSPQVSQKESIMIKVDLINPTPAPNPEEVEGYGDRAEERAKNTR